MCCENKSVTEEYDPHCIPMNATGKRRRVQPSLKEVILNSGTEKRAAASRRLYFARVNFHLPLARFDFGF